MQISLNPLAERELNDAAQYYELERPGLGAAFLAEIEYSCNRITELPESGPVVLNSIRRRLLRRFPYPDRPDIPIHIEAAAYRGRPVHFEILAPWSQPPAVTSDPVSARPVAGVPEVNQIRPPNPKGFPHARLWRA